MKSTQVIGLVFVLAMAGKLLTFATSRALGLSDRDELDRIVADTAQNKHRLCDLFHRIIQAEIFPEQVT